ncbi:nuclear transport factor 2 family protein [Actinopolymorpha sp. NPDC004070]|uniref:nuclear transport factor 2 family protein n=1 Tax=Actinopolymorpha sp. NPDC004070 TaxID=3154548 RepID=UPI0033B0E06F
MEQTPQETFQRHVAALSAGDLDTLVSDYAHGALVLTATGEYRGRTAIRELFEGLVNALPQLSLEAVSAVFADNLLLLHWRADSTLNSISDGVDTFVFNAGRIQHQTISCTLTPKT